MNIFRHCAGTVAVVTAMVAPVLFGLSSLAIEVSHWYLEQRTMQGAADAAVISAGAEYVQQFNATGGNPGTSYQRVGQQYALVNGYNIPTANVCLIDPSGHDGCSAVEALDARPIGCHTPPCVVVEITQNTFNWATTRASLEPTNHIGCGPGPVCDGGVQAIPTPILLARAVASVRSRLNPASSSDCVLAMANASDAILIHGGGDPQAKCGIAIDGGLTQNVGTPVVGGITFNGNTSKINVNRLTIAAKTANCPDDGTHCQQYGTPPQPALLSAQVLLGTVTADPYAAQVASLFATPPPAGANAIASKAAGSGYTKNATCTFTITGGTFYGTTNSPIIFTAATDKNGKISGIESIFDPGAYATPGFPTGNVSATSSNCGAGSGATFTLTQGCWAWDGVMTLPNRTYCSINLKGSGTTDFAAGNYWINGSGQCGGFCVSSNNATVTSAPAGVTFFLTNVANGGTATPYANVSITSGSISLCAPGTNCGNSCTIVTGNPASCMLFIQNPAATASTSNGGPPATDNTFTGNGVETLSGLIYLPRQTFDIGGGASTAGCVAVVAKYLDIGGSPTFSDGCLPGQGINSSIVPVLYQPHLSQ